MLTIARLHVLTLNPMNECRYFSVEAMKTVGLLVDISVVLGYKLPANFRWDDVGMNSRMC